MSRDAVFRWRGLSVRWPLGPVLLRLGLAVVLVACAVYALSSGSEATPLPVVLGYLRFGKTLPSDAQSLVIEAFRAPRIALACLTGAMLGLAGTVMQGVTRNGLADPGLLGVREGAALAIIATILLAPGLPLIWRPVPGLLGGAAAGLLTLWLARGTSQLHFVLVGLGVSWLGAAMLTILLSQSSTQSLQAAMIWLVGSLTAADWPAVTLAAAVLIPAFALLLLIAPASEIDALGAPLATALGVARRPLTVLRIGVSILLVATSVSVVGTLGFVGLIAPHLARALPGRSTRMELWGSALIGALLVLCADTLGRRAFAPVELPTGVFLAALGAPLLICLLWNRRNRL